MLTRRQQSELITAIRGRGEVPLKFAYLGEGAQHWDRIARRRSDAAGINATEASLLRRRVHDFLRSFAGAKKINIIDIGCGNGMPAFPLLDGLRQSGQSFRYVPVDISQELLDLAAATVQKHYPGCETRKVLLDFELGNFSEITYELKNDGSSNLLLFLGSTLGNHSDRNRVLTNFRDSMTADDYLLIGVELTNLSKINKILPHYKGKLVDDFMFFIPEHIGLKRRWTEWGALWNEREHQVEIRATVKRDVRVAIGSESFSLEKDEQLLLGRSVKFTEWSFTKLLSDIGFRTELLTTTPDRGYVLSMVQPTRYSV